MGQYSILIDAGKCIGCHACTAACKVKNDTPGGAFWTRVATVEQGTYPEARPYSAPLSRCMHCEYPACASACPVGALWKTEQGPVTYDAEKCIGCRYCMTACPFQTPKLNWDNVLPSVQKCQLCADRLAAELEPACTSACPTGALKFGGRSSLLAEAKERIRASGGQYVDHIYGENEVGGTSVLYVSPVQFEELGLPKLGPERVTELSEGVMLFGTPAIAGVAAIVLGGLYWFTRRRERQLSRSETKSSQADEE